MSTDKKMNDSSPHTGEGIEQAKETVEKFWNRTRKAGQEVEERVSEAGKEGWTAFKKYAQKHPARTALIALAAGVMMGRIFHSKSRSKELS